VAVKIFVKGWQSECMGYQRMVGTLFYPFCIVHKMPWITNIGNNLISTCGAICTHTIMLNTMYVGTESSREGARGLWEICYCDHYLKRHHRTNEEYQYMKR